MQFYTLLSLAVLLAGANAKQGFRALPVYNAPAPKANEQVSNTVVKATYKTVCPTGISTATTTATVAVPTTHTDPVEIIMTTTVAACTGCADGESVTIVVPEVTEVPIVPETLTAVQPGESGLESFTITASESGEFPVMTGIVTEPVAAVPTGTAVSSVEDLTSSILPSDDAEVIASSVLGAIPSEFDSYTITASESGDFPVMTGIVSVPTGAVTTGTAVSSVENLTSSILPSDDAEAISSSVLGALPSAYDSYTITASESGEFPVLTGIVSVPTGAVTTGTAVSSVEDLTSSVLPSDEADAISSSVVAAIPSEYDSFTITASASGDFPQLSGIVSVPTGAVTTGTGIEISIVPSAVPSDAEDSSSFLNASPSAVSTGTIPSYPVSDAPYPVPGNATIPAGPTATGVLPLTSDLSAEISEPTSIASATGAIPTPDTAGAPYGNATSTFLGVGGTGTGLFPISTGTAISSGTAISVGTGVGTSTTSYLTLSLPPRVVISTAPPSTVTQTIPASTTTLTKPDSTTTLSLDTTSTAVVTLTNTLTIPAETLTITAPDGAESTTTVSTTEITEVVTQTLPPGVITQTIPGSTITQTAPASTVTETKPGGVVTVTVPGEMMTVAPEEVTGPAQAPSTVVVTMTKTAPAETVTVTATSVPEGVVCVEKRAAVHPRGWFRF